MINFLEETRNSLKFYDKKEEDVECCGSDEMGWFTWEEFIKLADFEYNGDYGAMEVPTDLIILGEN